MHANDEGWRKGQKIAKRWYEMKHSALEIANRTALERYRITRLNWVQASISQSDIEPSEIESYIKKYCRYEQGTLSMLKKDIKEYSGSLPENIRRKIHELIFFFDTVQSNGGFLTSAHSKDEGKRWRVHIMGQLINGGIEKEDAEKYIADSFYLL